MPTLEEVEKELLTPEEIEEVKAMAKGLDELAKARERIELLEWLLHDAVKYLRAGKAQFAPKTTNSHVDYFLARIKRLEDEGKLKWK